MRGISSALIIIPGIILIVLSCNPDRFYRETHRIPDGKWNTKESKFECDMLYDLSNLSNADYDRNTGIIKK